MPDNNAIFLRLPEEMLTELDKLVEEKRAKNRQAVISEAVSLYLSAYDSMKRRLETSLSQSQPIIN